MAEPLALNVTKEALRESEARYRSLAELSSDWYWAQDANLRFFDFSSSLLSLAELPSEAFICKTHWEIGFRQMSESDRLTHQAVLDARLPFYDLEVMRNRPVWQGVLGQCQWSSDLR